MPATLYCRLARRLDPRIHTEYDGSRDAAGRRHPVHHSKERTHARHGCPVAGCIRVRQRGVDGDGGGARHLRRLRPHRRIARAVVAGGRCHAHRDRLSGDRHGCVRRGEVFHRGGSDPRPRAAHRLRSAPLAHEIHLYDRHRGFHRGSGHRVPGEQAGRVEHDLSDRPPRRRNSHRPWSRRLPAAQRGSRAEGRGRPQGRSEQSQARLNGSDPRARLGADARARPSPGTPRCYQGTGLGLEDRGVLPHLRHTAGDSENGPYVSAAPRISFVSLGCPKALVDSERIITKLRAEGYELAREHAGADLVVVNTCGFLDSARDESLAAIGSAIAENGRVIVTGCLGAEPEVIRAAHPKVLAVTGPQQYESVMMAVHAAVPPMHDPFLDLVPEQGIKLTPRHYAYLKISEGCNNRCSFCIIPRLRGTCGRNSSILRRRSASSGRGCGCTTSTPTRTWTRRSRSWPRAGCSPISTCRSSTARPLCRSTCAGPR